MRSIEEELGRIEEDWGGLRRIEEECRGLRRNWGGGQRIGSAPKANISLEKPVFSSEIFNIFFRFCGEGVVEGGERDRCGFGDDAPFFARETGFLERNLQYFFSVFATSATRRGIPLCSCVCQKILTQNSHFVNLLLSPV